MCLICARMYVANCILEQTSTVYKAAWLMNDSFLTFIVIPTPCLNFNNIVIPFI